MDSHKRLYVPLSMMPYLLRGWRVWFLYNLSRERLTQFYTANAQHIVSMSSNTHSSPSTKDDVLSSTTTSDGINNQFPPKTGALSRSYTFLPPIAGRTTAPGNDMRSSVGGGFRSQQVSSAQSLDRKSSQEFRKIPNTVATSTSEVQLSPGRPMPALELRPPLLPPVQKQQQQHQSTQTTTTSKPPSTWFSSHKFLLSNAYHFLLIFVIVVAHVVAALALKYTSYSGTNSSGSISNDPTLIDCPVFEVTFLNVVGTLGIILIVATLLLLLITARNTKDEFMIMTELKSIFAIWAALLLSYYFLVRNAHAKAVMERTGFQATILLIIMQALVVLVSVVLPSLGVLGGPRGLALKKLLKNIFAGRLWKKMKKKGRVYAAEVSTTTTFDQHDHYSIEKIDGLTNSNNAKVHHVAETREVDDGDGTDLGIASRSPSSMLIEVPMYKELAGSIHMPTTRLQNQNRMDKILAAVLNDAEACVAFERFLIGEFSIENLICYRSIQEFRKKARVLMPPDIVTSPTFGMDSDLGLYARRLVRIFLDDSWLGVFSAQEADGPVCQHSMLVNVTQRTIRKIKTAMEHGEITPFPLYICSSNFGHFRSSSIANTKSCLTTYKKKSGCSSGPILYLDF
ncbi:hypothetical protein HK102_006306 [Quaeritorhiza haematococci]|nr:hypothetical protein HK102_006306 [Quaeritorhiza haematococci]